MRKIQQAKKLVNYDDKLRHLRALANKGRKAKTTLFQKNVKSMTTMKTMTFSLDELQRRET